MTQSGTAEAGHLQREAGVWRGTAQAIFYAAGSLFEVFRTIASDPLGAYGLIAAIGFVLMALFAESIAPYGPFEISTDINGIPLRLQPPSVYHLLGTNHMGMDVFSQVVHGSRIAVIIGLSVAVLGAIIGSGVGILAGYSGGWVDQLLMRIVDVFYGIPFLPFALIFLAVAGPGIHNIIVVLVFLGWRGEARIIRSQTLTLKQRPFVQAARSAGASDIRIMFVHILPNVVPFIMLFMSLTVGSAVAAESGLSFLGFGDPLVSSWGQILNKAFLNGALRTAPWWILSPGIALTIFVTAWFFIGRAYETKINPRLRRE